MSHGIPLAIPLNLSSRIPSKGIPIEIFTKKSKGVPGDSIVPISNEILGRISARITCGLPSEMHADFFS